MGEQVLKQRLNESMKEDLAKYAELSKQKADVESEQKILNAKIKKALGEIKLTEIGIELAKNAIEKDPAKKLTPEKQRLYSELIQSHDYERALKLGGFRYEEAGYIANNIPQDRSSIDQEKAVSYLKELGLTGCVKTVEIVDEEALESAMFKGLIVPETFKERCINENIILTLKVTKVKEKKSK
jgi:hypothetical protein